MKILVIRFSSIGDIVLTTPIIRCLKKQLDCEIHFLLKDSYRSLLENSPYVDNILTLKDDLRENLRMLKLEGFDIIIDLHKNIRSARVRSYLGIRSKSFPKLNFQKWLLVNTGIHILPDKHLVDRYFEAIKDLGVINDGQGLDMFIPDDLLAQTTQDWALNDHYALAIGGSYHTKKLPAYKLVELIENLSRPVCLIGGQEDREAVKFIIDNVEDASFEVINTVGKLSMLESAAIIKHSPFLVTHDTGMMHIGAAFKKPIISVWGSSVPGFGMRPYYGKHLVPFIMMEVSGLNCRPCSKLGHIKCPKGHFRCMKEQSFENVAIRASQMLD